MDDNPFGETGGLSDPFDDPTVMRAKGNYAEENPFESAGGGYGNLDVHRAGPKKGSAKAKGKASLISQSAYGGSSDSWGSDLGPSSSSTPAGGGKTPAGGASSLGGGDVHIREDNLLRREQRLRDRERELDEREAGLDLRGGRMPNWPSRCYPLLYHSISTEIPPMHQQMVRKFYVTVLWTWVCLLWNWICIMAVMFGAANKPANTSSDALWATIYVILGVPGSWNLWYRGCYNAMKNNSGGKWVMFFINYMAHIIFSCIMCIAPPWGWGGGGLFLMTNFFSGDPPEHGLLFMCLVATILWGLNCLFSVYLLKVAHRAWKKTGHEGELKKEMMKTAVAASVDSGSI